MALDNNHVTKLGELKQLIDGLWGKVTTAISNAVSGLLSKSEAAETYATKGEIPSTDNFAKKDGSNATGTWSNITAGKATTDTNGNNIADTFNGLRGARRYVNYGTRSWNNATFLVTAYVGKSNDWLPTSYTGDVSMIEVGDVLVLDVENTSLGSNGKFAHFLLFIEVTVKSDTSPTGVVIACVHSNEQATLDVTNVNADNFIIPGIYNLFGCTTENNWGGTGRETLYVSAGTTNGATLGTANAFVEQRMSGTDKAYIRTCSNGTWRSWRWAPMTAEASSVGSANKPVFVDTAGRITACDFGVSYVFSLPSFANMVDGVLYVM